MKVFKDYALYYNAFYQDKDYAAEAGQVDMLLKKYGKSVRTVMNFGCGTGRHDMELSRLGYECSGIDMSSLMIDIAKKNTGYGQAEINFAVADIDWYGLPVLSCTMRAISWMSAMRCWLSIKRQMK